MLLDIFKKKKDEELENVKMIPIPDIRAYMVKGYEEIREIKAKAEEEEQQKNNYKELAERNEKLYNATLISLQEFEDRYNTSKATADRYKKLYEEEKEKREDDNYKNKNEINELKSKLYSQNIKLEKAKTIISNETIQEFINKFDNVKGNLSKARVIRILNGEEWY